ncbi:MAG: hypothetical protein WCL61_00435 [bacterium]
MAIKANVKNLINLNECLKKVIVFFNDKEEIKQVKKSYNRTPKLERRKKFAIKWVELCETGYELDDFFEQTGERELFQVRKKEILSQKELTPKTPKTKFSAMLPFNLFLENGSEAIRESIRTREGYDIENDIYEYGYYEYYGHSA